MMSTTRQNAIRTISTEPFREIQQGTAGEGRSTLPEDFGSLVFNDQVQRQRLPRPVYKALRRTIETGAKLDPEMADAVANAMKDWAIEGGATHYTHWFQPMTGLTAEKHDAFLETTAEGKAVLEFSGKQLVQGEPDASSFPSGGLRATFEARGYTAWDPTSPAFLRKTCDGSTLTIPTAFCSWTGDALDKKTPLLRSCEAVSTASVRLLNLIGESNVTRVTPTAGVEQEYFLLDRKFFHMRPDMVSCGRTLFGAPPPKGQEMDDHYFGAISQRALAFMMDVERELWRLGIPLKTRHNEVAPTQFEFAPIYGPISVSADQNMLTMEILQDVAARHGMECLLHEKPYEGLNGSGKHLNWSLADNLGNNLLNPGGTPHENLKFILFLTAIIRGVDLHQDLLRAAIASAGNDHRLGANEAPPAIISIFVGCQLEEIINSLIEGRAPEQNGSEKLRLGVTSLPDVPRDMSDRNRTSPFAFTGDKFEFRAVSSRQSVAYPSTFLNLIVSESLDFLCDEIERRGGPSTENIEKVVQSTLKDHQRILYGGDNYSQAWTAEASKRGLLNLRGTPEALAGFASETNLSLFERYNVFSRGEAVSRYKVLNEQYAQKVNVEARLMREIATSMIMPAALQYQRDLCDSMNSLTTAMPNADTSTQETLLTKVTAEIAKLQTATDNLTDIQHAIEASDLEDNELAVEFRERVMPAMGALRLPADRLERLVDDSLWPLPKYREMLFVH